VTRAQPTRPGPDDPVFAERYRAMSSRDARFDGQFITGVHSTGIYCRPSCPAVPPKPKNITFHPTAATSRYWRSKSRAY
jgi:AraC family transcriptional regulator of adaptative response / DNA-3-methyladenine glycosylase II